MATTRLASTSNNLGLRNPHVIAAWVRLLLAAGLLAVLGACRSDLKDAFDSFLATPPGHAREPAHLIQLGALLVSALAALAAALHVVVSIILAIRWLMNFFVPVRVPNALWQADTVLGAFFRDRVISSFAKPSGWVWTVIAMVSPRLRFVTLPYRDIPEALIRGTVRALVTLGILTAGSIALAQDSRVPAVLHYSIPWALGIVALFTILVRLAAVLVTLPDRPQVIVSEKRHHLESAGHPSNFFNHVMQSANVMRFKNFVNRELFVREPRLGRTRTGETNEFSAAYAFETQPTPVASGRATGALVFDIGGAALRVAGYALLIGAAAQTPAFVENGRPLDLLLYVLTGCVALRQATRCLRTAHRIRNIFRWESDVFRVVLKGTYTASRMGIGDGRGGEAYTERSVFQSDTHLHYYAARIISESDSLENERVIIGSTDTAEFERRRSYFDREILGFEDSGSQLVAPDMVQGGAANIIQTNMTVQKLRGTPATAPQLAGPSQDDSARRLLAGADDSTKPCPDCAEQVRAAARKCRYCGHEFAGEVAQS